MSLERALLHLVRGAVFLVPLVALLQTGPRDWLFRFLPSSFYPFITWRNFLFRIAVEVMFGLWVVLALRNPRYRPRFSWVLGALSAFVAVVALADVCGVDPTRSFWSDFERMEGLIGLLHLLAFTVVAGTVLDRHQLWKALLGVSLVACAVVCLDSVTQIVHAVQKQQGLYDGKPFLQAVPQRYMGSVYFRIDARIASPVFLAVYLLFHVFFAALCVIGGGRTWQRWACAGLGLWCVVLLFFTGTRVAMAGLVAGTLVAAGAAALLHPSPGVRRVTRVVAATAVVLVGMVFVVILFDPPFVRDLLPARFTGERIALNLGERASLWGIAWQGFLAHPLLGWGQESFHAVFDGFYEPSLYGPEVSNWFDHPHNVFLSWLVTGGLPAMLAYVAVFVAAFWGLWRCDLALAQKCVLTGLLVGYTLFNCFELDNVTSYIVFCSVLAFIHTKTARPPSATPRAVGWPATAAVAALVVTGIGVAIHQANLRPLGAAIALHDAHVRPVEVDERRQPRLTIARALDGGPLGRTGVREVLAKYAPTLDATRWPQQRREAVELAIRELRAEIAARPDDVRALFFLGRLLAQTGRSAEAVQHLEHALSLSPNRQALLLQLAQVYLVLERRQDAARLFETFHELTPRLRAGLVQCAIGAVWARDRQLEKRMLDLLRARQKSGVFRPDPAIIDALLRNGRADTVVELLEPVLEDWRQQRRANPTTQLPDFVAARYFALATARVQLAQRDAAVRLMEEVSRVHPASAERARGIISEIQGR